MHQLPEPVAKIWRYYKVGLLNTLFGYSLYAILLKLGLWLYLAQIASHLIGMAFNYFSYSHHVFTDAKASKARFVISYLVNYLVGLASLAGASRFMSSPYIAGLAAILVASAINFLVLSRIVFRPTAA